MTDEEIAIHKPVCADFVSFRSGIRCAERVYQVERQAALLKMALDALTEIREANILKLELKQSYHDLIAAIEAYEKGTE